MLGNFGRDLTFALRIWRRQPFAAALMVASLSVGLAATALTFAVLNAFFLRPLAVRDPGRIVRIYTSTPQGLDHFTVSYPDFADLRDLDTVFAGVIAEEPAPFSLSAGSVVERIYGDVVAGGYFSVLGVRPAAGRFFTEEEEHRRAEADVAVIGHDLWSRRFHRDPAVVGTAVIVNGRPCVIIGVAPKGFDGVTTGVRPDLWRPAQRDRTVNRGGRAFFVAARLRPDVTIGEARAAVDTLALRLQRQYPDTNAGVRFPVLSEADSRTHPMVRGSILGLSGSLLTVASLVLLLACVNVAGVLAAAALARRKEVGVRLAIGASRGRVLGQFLTEAVLLAAIAAGVGAALTWIGMRALQAISLPTRIPIFIDFGADARVLVFSGLAMLASAAFFGGVPAIAGTRLTVVEALKSSWGRAPRPSRLQGALVLIQVAIAVTLVMCGAVFLRSLENAHRIHLGFDPDGVVTASVDPGLHGYPPAATAAFWSRLKTRLITSPSSESVTIASAVPFEINITRVSMTQEGHRNPPDLGWPSIDWSAVDAAYFDALRIPLIEGRDFRPHGTDSGAGVVIINRELARRFWSGQSAVGRRVVTASGERYQVVGVVENSRHLTLGEEVKPHVYFPFDPRGGAGTIVLRTTGDLQRALLDVREAVAALDPTLPIYNASTMHDHVRTAMLPSLGAATAAGIAASIALLLIAIGLYASVSRAVVNRTHEISVRYALGARRSDVLVLVLRQALVVTAAGWTAGAVLGTVAVRALRTFVYGVEGSDPFVTIAAPLAVAAVGVIAAVVPALTAARIGAISSLRAE